jgi:hypothetical protein
MSQVETASSWIELQEMLFHDAWDERIGRFRSQMAFRGVSCNHYTLRSSLMRLGGSFQDLEPHLIRNFQKYSHRDVVERDSIWHWLSLAQHHGLPTRLLDWTFSPYTALHFVTANTERYDQDGAIWAVNYVKAHELLPEKLRQLLEREGSDVFTTNMLAEAVSDLRELGSMSEEPYVLFFEPPSLDDRIVNQYALFSVMSEPGGILCSWLEKYPELWRRIVIPAELKWEVRDKLDQANITERVLFPGLDGLSRWLKRHYSPRMEEIEKDARRGPASG